ncbi:MAG TPA: hypothetical protein VFW46_20130 [Stellaceae bacterium]|nr:hypothetical protein [Stellaceae bacterium]
MLAPASEAFIVAELGRLRSLTVSRDIGQDLALVFAAYVGELREYPADAIRDVLRGSARSNKFWPSIAELIDPLDRLVRPRKALRRALVSGKYQPPETSPDWIAPTPEDIAEAEALLRAHGLWDAETGRPKEHRNLPPMPSAAERERMAAELDQFRERWVSLAQDANAGHGH